MKQKHILVGCSTRSASNWLADMFKLNHEDKPLHSVHEQFLGSVTKALRLWQGREGTNISVGHEAGPLMAYLHDLFPNAQWHYLWREPVDQFCSIMTHKRLTEQGKALHRVGWEWGARESELRLAEKLGIELQHWHMSYYTTADGFRAMADAMGVKLKQRIRLSKLRNLRAHPSYRDQMEDWPEKMRALVMSVWDSHDYVKAAYEVARRG